MSKDTSHSSIQTLDATPGRAGRPESHWQRPATQALLKQSLLAAQSLPEPHLEQAGPPQSTSVSWPFFTKSPQDDWPRQRPFVQLCEQQLALVWHIVPSGWHCDPEGAQRPATHALLRQSLFARQRLPRMHLGQAGPPQSTSASWPFFTRSLQDDWPKQTPFVQLCEQQLALVWHMAPLGWHCGPAGMQTPAAPQLCEQQLAPPMQGCPSSTHGAGDAQTPLVQVCEQQPAFVMHAEPLGEHCGTVELQTPIGPQLCEQQVASAMQACPSGVHCGTVELQTPIGPQLCEQQLAFAMQGCASGVHCGVEGWQYPIGPQLCEQQLASDVHIEPSCQHCWPVDVVIPGPADVVIPGPADVVTPWQLAVLIPCPPAPPEPPPRSCVRLQPTVKKTVLASKNSVYRMKPPEGTRARCGVRWPRRERR